MPIARFAEDDRSRSVDGRSGSAHGIAGARDLVRVVDQTVEDSVGEHRIADAIVSFLDGKLACHDGGSASVTVLDSVQGGLGPVID